jgi:hypothetical protein
MDHFDHLIRIDSATRELKIFRVTSDGRQSLYTATPLPASVGWTAELEAFAKQLGENVLLDSPDARKALGL